MNTNVHKNSSCQFLKFLTPVAIVFFFNQCSNSFKKTERTKGHLKVIFARVQWVIWRKRNYSAPLLLKELALLLAYCYASGANNIQSPEIELLAKSFKVERTFTKYSATKIALILIRFRGKLRGYKLYFRSLVIVSFTINETQFRDVLRPTNFCSQGKWTDEHDVLWRSRSIDCNPALKVFQLTDNLDYGQLLRNNGDVVSRLLFKIPTRGKSDEELRGFCVLGSGLRPKVTGGGVALWYKLRSRVPLQSVWLWCRFSENGHTFWPDLGVH